MKAFGLEIAIIIVLSLINGIFAMSEVALLSAGRVRLQHTAKRGNARARRALHLIEQPNTVCQRSRSVSPLSVSSQEC